jgi:hypothetical protein
MTEISVPLHSRRRDRVHKVQKLQHIVPATGLLMDAMQVLSS